MYVGVMIGVMITWIPCMGYGTVVQRDKPPKTKRKFCPKRCIYVYVYVCMYSLLLPKVIIN